ncbi:MAG: glycosyltransferase family 4 protein [Flavipsychrobacter sp.]
MNILYLCDEYPPGRHGGIGTVVHMLAHTMADLGHKVTVVGFYDWGYGGKDEFDDGKVKVYRFRRGMASKLFEEQDSLFARGLFKLCKVSGLFQRDIKKSLVRYKAFVESLIERHNIDIIEMPDYNDYIRFCNSYVPFPKFSVPTVVKLHGSLTYIGHNNNTEVPAHVVAMERHILAQAEGVCSVSKYRADMAQVYKEYEGDIAVMYNGIETASIQPYETKYHNRVVFTGTLNANKGIFQLAKAWNKVVSKLPDAELVVFGKGPIEKIKALLTEQAKAMVSFKGHVPRADLFQYLGESAVAIFPSYAESFALAPMEAMACKTAVVYTKRTSGPELIEDNVNGMLVDPDDVEGIAEKLLQLLTNPDLAQQLGERARQHVLDNFSMRVVGQKHTGYYQSILEANNSLRKTK